MKSRFSPSLWTAFIVVSVALLVTASWSIIKVISPAPPRALAMSTGALDGAYHQFGLKYQALLKTNGIALELKPSTGSIENLARLNTGEVSVSFVQGGLGGILLDPEEEAENTPLRSLGTIGFEPVWIFSHKVDLSGGLQPLLGRKIAVGVAGSGNHKVAMELLGAYGLVDAQGQPRAGTELVFEGGTGAATRLQNHAIDAMLIVAGPQAGSVKQLLADPAMKLASLSQAEGLARRFPYFQTVSLKRGSVDPARDLPATDITLLSTTASLVIHEDLHPALAYLLLEAARQAHAPATLLSRPGTFPKPEGVEFALSAEASQYYKNGRPFLQTYLPFWMANFVQRLGLMAVPLIALLLPFFRVVLPAISWWQKSRINRRYGELKFLEAEIAKGQLTPEEIARAHQQLDHIEHEVTSSKFPLDFTDRIYTLRQHVGFVRDSLARQKAP
ncbi:MAG TPA: TAXI family TRAP transporter solute-binding subunit [Rhodoferax sp.]|mgnify:FL=1|nr:TAXI family TRAP transporter solute-binding subunit [Rhodoferax sp.]